MALNKKKRNEFIAYILRVFDHIMKNKNHNQ